MTRHAIYFDGWASDVLLFDTADKAHAFIAAASVPGLNAPSFVARLADGVVAPIECYPNGQPTGYYRTSLSELMVAA